MGDLHCWEDRREDISRRFGHGSDVWARTYAEDWKNGTCMLPSDHVGPHEFVDDDSIVVAFPEVQP